jgi:rhodanese-related sulfurtransferase
VNTEIAVTPLELASSLRAFPAPTLVDVRRAPAFAADPRLIPGALRRLPEALADWAGDLEPWRPVVVYCVHGHEVSVNAATALRERGFAAGHLAGGIEAWKEGGGAVVAPAAPTRWVTRERPKIDRIACPWLVRRFIDPSAEFFYVPAAEVRTFAATHGATPYDIADVAYGHAGTQCSFDAFVRLHGLRDPALHRLSTIVRAADTGTPAMAAEAAGLLAISYGLAAAFAADHAMLRWGMLVYDALYARCRTECADDAGARLPPAVGAPQAAA